ncbi:hypothetical protein D4764_18G0011240 [Takifugu flavidus]|uniref:Uncharacterized protein n=1 Tax=Takifugu flavidus TaxID=433684 RepID=A0A5C6NU24_9TELE|nr:hypothetical protein D4764_18G0011240 [Takifugu flavidus]
MTGTPECRWDLWTRFFWTNTWQQRTGSQTRNPNGKTVGHDHPNPAFCRSSRTRMAFTHSADPALPWGVLLAA